MIVIEAAVGSAAWWRRECCVTESARETATVECEPYSLNQAVLLVVSTENDFSFI